MSDKFNKSIIGHKYKTARFISSLNQIRDKDFKKSGHRCYTPVYFKCIFSKIVIYIYFIFFFSSRRLNHDSGKKQLKYSCVLNNSSKFGGMDSM